VVADDADEEEEGSTGRRRRRADMCWNSDAARKIAQGLGANLEKCESLVEIKGDKARLLTVSERTQYLFGRMKAEG